MQCTSRYFKPSGKGIARSWLGVVCVVEPDAFARFSNSRARQWTGGGKVHQTAILHAHFHPQFPFSCLDSVSFHACRDPLPTGIASTILPTRISPVEFPCSATTGIKYSLNGTRLVICWGCGHFGINRDVFPCHKPQTAGCHEAWPGSHSPASLCLGQEAVRPARGWPRIFLAAYIILNNIACRGTFASLPLFPCCPRHLASCVQFVLLPPYCPPQPCLPPTSPVLAR